MAIINYTVEDTDGNQLMAPSGSQVMEANKDYLVTERDGIFGAVIDVGTSANPINVQLEKNIKGVGNIAFRFSRYSDFYVSWSFEISNSRVYPGGIASNSGTTDHIISADEGRFLLLWAIDPSIGTYNGIEFGNINFGLNGFYASYNPYTVSGNGACYDSKTLITKSDYNQLSAGATLAEVFGFIFPRFPVSNTTGNATVITHGKYGTERTRASALYHANTSAFRVETSELHGEVVPGDFDNAQIVLNPNYYYYDGQFKTPDVTVYYNGVQLTEGTDYTKTYENNLGPGLAAVLVAGKGNYSGSKRAYFSIYSATTPYDNLEPSGPSDTKPTYDYSSDSVGKPAVPTLSMSDIGFVRIYNPSKTQLQSLAQYLWTDSTFLDTIINHAKQLLENPIDGIICLNLLPCDIPNGGTEEFKLLFVPTGVQLTVAANQFVEVNCGKVTIETVYGSALDYAPYTKASMFLPYVGQVSLNIDEIMGKTLRVYYHIDIVSGGCVAMVEVDGTVMYQFSGHCAISMPLTGADYSNIASAMISTVKAAATMGANAGAGIAQAAMEMMSGSKKDDSIIHNTIGDSMVAVGEGIEFTSLAARNIANTVGAVMGSKPEISRTGTFSGNTGYLGVRRPYVILERPRLCNPSEYGKFNGYPSMQTVTLNNISGFTQVQQVQLTGISATASELNEIEKLLKSGVIL